MNRHQRRAHPKQAGTAPTRLLNPSGLRAFQAAVELMKAGRWQESEMAHQRVLASNPRHSPSLHHLGLVAFKCGQAEKAIESLRLAVEVEPGYCEARLNLAVILNAQGVRADALAECRKVIEREPNNAAAHAELGSILKNIGENTGAASAYRHAFALRPDIPGVDTKLAQCLIDSGDAAGCIEICQRLLARDPLHNPARRLYVRALAALGRTGEAFRIIDLNVDDNGERSELFGDIATGLHLSGKSTDAVDFIRQAIARYPDAVDLHLLLGTMLKDIGRLDEAFEALKDGLDRDPSRVDGYVTLGFVLHGQGATDGAVAALRHAAALKPNLAGTHIALGSVLQTTGRFEEAKQAFEQVLACNSRAIDSRVALCSVRRHLCDWDGLDREEAECLAEVRAADATVTPFQLLGMPVSNEDMRNCGARYAHQITQKVVTNSMIRPDQKFIKPDGRIRIGYLSSDFGHHATSMLLAEVLELHDRNKFEVVGYCHSPDEESPLRRRVVSAFERFISFRNVGHIEAAEKIRADGIEILIDLKGYTRGARQEILAQRPAPIQVSYLGYPATSGADYLDYILADGIVAPMEHQPHYSERIVHLGTCYQPNDSKRQIDSRPVTRADCGLPEDGFVFCSFNNNFKLNRTFFGIWMNLLHQVPGSVLWLLMKNPLVRTNLEREASAHGIDPKRVVFADSVPIEQHLARHAVADLFLDSLPCTAHTTASDALWAGLPLLTCLGPTFAGRVAASVLNACGLPELITATLDQYAATALRLALDRNELDTLKAKLRAQRMTAPLYKTAKYVRELEDAFTRMSRLYREGKEPQSFAVSDKGDA